MSTESNEPGLPAPIEQWLTAKYDYLLGVAYRGLWAKGRQQSSPQSVVGSAIRSLLQNPKHQEAMNVASATGAIGPFLIKAVLRHSWRRRKQVERKREIPFSDLEKSTHAERRGGSAIDSRDQAPKFDPPDHALPMPSDQQYEEALLDLLGQLTSRQCEIVLLLLENQTPQQIASFIRCSKSLVYAELKSVRQLLNRGALPNV
jgi:DNA-binding CsgD family transcriptional regulator